MNKHFYYNYYKKILTIVKTQLRYDIRFLEIKNSPGQADIRLFSGSPSLTRHPEVISGSQTFLC